MSTTGIAKAILTIGLAHPPPPSMQAMLKELGVQPAAIAASAQNSIQKARDAGYDIQSVLITPGQGEASDGVDKLVAKLPERAWDGIMVGFGVRGTPEYTTTFEKVMNLFKEQCPDVKVGFNSRPDDLYDAIVRNFDGK